MNIFTSIKQQKLSSTDGTFFTANTIKLTQTEITQLETEDFFSNATQNNCELIIFPIKVSDVLTSEEDVYNEEYLANLRKIFKLAQNYNLKFLFLPQIDEDLQKDYTLTIKSMKHTARRLKKFENIIGFAIPEEECFKNEKVRQEFISELSEKHEHYKFIVLS